MESKKDDSCSIQKSSSFIHYLICLFNLVLDKAYILDSYNGFEYLGYRFRVINNKIVINIKSENKRRRDNNIRKNSYLYRCGYISYRRYFNSMNNYKNSCKYVKNNKY